MNLSKIVMTAVAGMLLLSAGAFAQEKGKLSLTENLTVQGKVLKPGNYKLQPGRARVPNVQLSIIQGRETVITVPATVVAGQNENRASAYSSRTAADGTKSLEAFYPEGKKIVLELGSKKPQKTNPLLAKICSHNNLIGRAPDSWLLCRQGYGRLFPASGFAALPATVR